MHSNDKSIERNKYNDSFIFGTFSSTFGLCFVIVPIQTLPDLFVSKDLKNPNTQTLFVPKKWFLT